MHGCRWTQAASGAAGWANVGLCLASSMLLLHSAPLQWWGISHRRRIDRYLDTLLASQTSRTV